MAIHPPSVPKWDNDVRLAAQEIDALFPRRDWTSTYPGHGEHSAVGAYAIDFLVSDKATGDKIVAYCIKNRKRLGIRYIIWYRRIINWGIYGDKAQWRTYFDANAKNANGTPNPSRQHTNHPHVSFEVNAKHIPLDRVPVEKPRPVIDRSNLDAAIKSSDYSGEVLALQKALDNWRPSLRFSPDGSADGYWGALTRDAVATYQQWRYGVAKGHPDADGIPGAETLTNLGFEVKA